MTQPEGAPLATAEAALLDPEALGDASALERQISLLSTRIKSIAKHLQVFLLIKTFASTGVRSPIISCDDMINRQPGQNII